MEAKFSSDLPSLREIEQSTVLAFVNTNSAFDQTIPLPENVIPVGGLHISDSKPLPEVKRMNHTNNFKSVVQNMNKVFYNKNIISKVFYIQDLENYIISARKGAILFSLGSNVHSSSMNIEKQKIILDAFEQFPDYNFLWKFEKPSIDLKLPENVIIRPWLPQSDILAHPKVIAFVTHSGNVNETFLFSK